MPSKYDLHSAAVLQFLVTVLVFLWWGERVGALFVTGSVWLLMAVRAYAKKRVTTKDALQGVFVHVLGTGLAAYWWDWRLAVVWFFGISWASFLVKAFTLAEFVR